MTIFGIRIWPRPSWPLIHKARRIYKEGGDQAFREWAEQLSPEDSRALRKEVSSLLEAACRKVIKEIEEEGKAAP